MEIGIDLQYLLFLQNLRLATSLSTSFPFSLF